MIHSQRPLSSWQVTLGQFDSCLGHTAFYSSLSLIRFGIQKYFTKIVLTNNANRGRVSVHLCVSHFLCNWRLTFIYSSERKTCHTSIDVPNYNGRTRESENDQMSKVRPLLARAFVCYFTSCCVCVCVRCVLFCSAHSCPRRVVKLGSRFTRL